MRPVSKGATPNENGFYPYDSAKSDLVSRLDRYCSYCERRLATNIAVEHLIPKGGEHGDPELENDWRNFLIACTNCNSCKGSKQVLFTEMVFPDRDNSFVAFEYHRDGSVSPSPNLSNIQRQLAANTLKLTGLDKPVQQFRDSNDQIVSLDRKTQRMDAFLVALDALDEYQRNCTASMKRMVINLAKAEGFFSIWMKVFMQYPEIKKLLIEEHQGTSSSGCFCLLTGDTVTPAPNPDGMQHGGKV